MFRRNLLLILLASAAAAGCNTSAAPPPPTKLPDVVVGRADERPVTDYEEFQGKTEAEKSIDVRAHVSGYLDRYNFKDGAEVRQNEVLFEIDPRPFNAELERSKAMVAQADAHMKRLENDFRARQSLWAKNSISREDYDKAYGDLDEARSALKAAVAAQNTAQLNVTYSRVTAPISGRISRRFVDPGNMVKADDTILTRIVSLDPMYAYFDIDERTYLRIQRFHQSHGTSAGGQQQTSLEMGLSDEKGFPNKGQVDFTDNRVDPDSGSVWLRGVFPNPKKLLTGGLFVRVRLPVGERHPAVLIPEQALVADQGQKHVWVVDGDNHATYRQIQLGAQHGTLRVVEKGVSAGERVIVSGGQRVRKTPGKDYAEVNVTHEEPLGEDEQ